MRVIHILRAHMRAHASTHTDACAHTHTHTRLHTTMRASNTTRIGLVGMHHCSEVQEDYIKEN